MLIYCVFVQLIVDFVVLQMLVSDLVVVVGFGVVGVFVQVMIDSQFYVMQFVEVVGFVVDKFNLQNDDWLVVFCLGGLFVCLIGGKLLSEVECCCEVMDLFVDDFFVVCVDQLLVFFINVKYFNVKMVVDIVNVMVDVYFVQVDKSWVGSMQCIGEMLKDQVVVLFVKLQKV